MTSVKFTSNLPALAKDLEARAWKSIAKAVVFFWEEVSQSLNKSYPPASRPGEPPRKRTGWLQANVTYELDRGRLSGRVGVTEQAPYGRVLEEKMDRSFMASTLARVKGRIEKILAGG